MVANRRTGPGRGGDASLQVVKRVADKHGLSLEVVQRRDASPCTDIDGEVYRTVARTILECFPGIGVAPYFIMGGTDARHFYALSDNVLRFTPIGMTTAQMESCHAVDENVSLDSLARGVEFYKRFLRGWRA